MDAKQRLETAISILHDGLALANIFSAQKEYDVLRPDSRFQGGHSLYMTIRDAHVFVEEGIAAGLACDVPERFYLLGKLCTQYHNLMDIKHESYRFLCDDGATPLYHLLRQHLPKRSRRYLRSDDIRQAIELLTVQQSPLAHSF